MFALSLQSGSSGNCIYVETAGARLLFDAGISGAQAERRLAAHGRDIRRVDALIISHDHADHIRCAGVFQRKYGLPIYVTRRTLEGAMRCLSLGMLHDVRFFKAGDALEVGDVVVETVRTPHDACDGVAFIVARRGRRLGILTDLGHVFDGLGEVVASLDAAFLESNYDPEMLANGPYPPQLQARIRGPRGHLSNVESARLVRDCAYGRLIWLCLAHLSEHNNTPELALQTHRTIARPRHALHAASRYKPTGPFTL